MRRATRMGVMMLLLCAVLALSAAPAPAANEPAKPMLTSTDCVKCHSVQPSEIDSKGAKHKTITCQDCHSGHRPSSKNNIPVCSQCHQGKPHFEIKGCLNCHKNPHTPLGIKFPDNTTDACLTCHTNQIKQLRENKSKHTAFACTKCHGDTHRTIPACTQCHKPHSNEMTKDDCKKCHKAHMPKVVTYGSDTSSKLCASCHLGVYKMLSASKVKHSSLACAFCHQDKHKAIPSCKTCHGDKHPASIMAKFPKCGECHKIAHDLNNWAPPAKAAPGAPAADTKAKGKKKRP